MADRLLLIADDTLDELAELPQDLCERLRDSAHVHVVAPTTGSRLETLTEDDAIYRDAVERADRIAGLVADEGVDVTADHSESAPLESATAALKAGAYDGVVVVTTSEGHWREEGLLQELRSASGVPVHPVTLD